MRSAIRKQLSLILLLGLASLTALASDFAKERRWADQIVDALLVGEPVWLQAEGHEFLGIYAEATSTTPTGGVILLHGIGVHPDWPQVIAPLRSELPTHGWTTLSIQLPVLANEALDEDYAPLFDLSPARIRTAVEHMKGKGLDPIVIVGHSLGATMGSAYLADGQDTTVRGFVGIGMGAVKADPRMDNRNNLKEIRLPVLDLYGQNDNQGVRDMAPERAAAAKAAGNERYTQQQVAGADHFFDGKEDALISAVVDWLRQTQAGPAVK